MHPATFNDFSTCSGNTVRGDLRLSDNFPGSLPTSATSYNPNLPNCNLLSSKYIYQSNLCQLSKASRGYWPWHSFPGRLSATETSGNLLPNSYQTSLNTQRKLRPYWNTYSRSTGINSPMSYRSVYSANQPRRGNCIYSRGGRVGSFVS